jgi:hypothetical protein
MRTIHLIRSEITHWEVAIRTRQISRQLAITELGLGNSPFGLTRIDPGTTLDQTIEQPAA